MPGDNDDDDKGKDGKNDGEDSDEAKFDLKDPKVKAMVEKLIADSVGESLKPVKEKLDKAYEQRDKALEKLDALEKKDRDAELARLKEAGKHQEAFDLQIKEEKRLREAAEKKNLELTRDLDVRGALSGLEFRNENALEMAFKEILPQMVKNDQGTWVHNSGKPVKDYAKSFAEQEANSFLFKTKVNNGSGTGTPANGPGTPGGDSKPKSLFSMSQDEVLKMAEEGKLPNQQ